MKIISKGKNFIPEVVPAEQSVYSEVSDIYLLIVKDDNSDIFFKTCCYVKNATKGWYTSEDSIIFSENIVDVFDTTEDVSNSSSTETILTEDVMETIKNIAPRLEFTVKESKEQKGNLDEELRGLRQIAEKFKGNKEVFSAYYSALSKLANSKVEYEGNEYVVSIK